jgi:RND family efflux transporter MFP subunit
VTQAKPEAELTTVKLSPEAVQRLGVHLTEVSNQSVAGTRTLAGDVVVPDGESVVVAAPVAGTLSAAGPLTPGARVAKGAAIFRLQPIASAERDQRIEAERATATAQAENEAATQRLQRLERLLAEGAASQRMVEEARAQQAAAAAALTAARARTTAASAGGIGARGELTIAAPIAGVLQTVTAAAGQTVAAAAPLFTVTQTDRIWVRVPVYAGDQSALNLNQPVSVFRLGQSEAPRPAQRVVSPPRADPTSASIDAVYELPAGTPALKPGERVTVEIPLASADSGLVVPDSAVVIDIHGDTWVYQEVGEHTFARRRVAIARHLGGKAVVERGLVAGAKVVDIGAAELFGTEFGTGK